MQTKVRCYQLKTDCYRYKKFYLACICHSNHKAKIHSRRTKDKQKKLKAYQYRKSSNHKGRQKKRKKGTKDRSFFSSANVSSIVSLNIVSMKYHFFCYLTIINVVRILNLNYPSSNAIIFSLNIIVYFPSSSIFGKSLSRASSALIDMLLCMAFNILNSVLFLFILLSFISAS